MRLVPSETAHEQARPVRLPTLDVTLASGSPLRILDFDLETLAAGYADPNWVPDKIMVAAWSWVGEDTVTVVDCGKLGFFNREPRREMLAQLLEEIDKADVLTGHNIARFDLPVINAECMRLGLPVISQVKIEDTMRVRRSKGFKKGQDVLTELFRVPIKKQAMNWQEWQDAYEADGWEYVRSRCSSDVLAHKMLRIEMLAAGILKPITNWRA